MHNVPCKFPFQTRDLIEKYHHKEILKNFPQYAEFWSKFIGVKEANINNVLSSYDLISVGSVSPNLPSFQKIHEEICMSHYSVFCNLATAHFNLTELSKLGSSDNYTYLFAHWRLFDSAYMHLGAAWQEIIHIWDLILEKFDNFPKLLNDHKSANKLINFLQKSHPVLESERTSKIKPIIEFRNIIAHYFRVPSRYSKGRTRLPETVGKQFLWSDLPSYSGPDIDTIDKLSNDITTLESFIDSTHNLLIPEFERVLKKHSLKIDYSTGKQDVFCNFCKWYKEEMNTLAYIESNISSSNYIVPSGMVSGNVKPPVSDSESRNPLPGSEPILGSGIQLDILANYGSNPQIPQTTGDSEIDAVLFPKIYKCGNPKCGK